MKNIITILFILFSSYSSFSQNEGKLYFNDEGEKIYLSTEVEKKPELLDGMKEYLKYYSKNLKTPDFHLKSIKQYFAVLIETDGTISNVIYVNQEIEYCKLKVVNTKSEADDNKFMEEEIIRFKEENIRLLKEYKGKWKSGIKDGKPVRCQIIIPFATQTDLE